MLCHICFFLLFHLIYLQPTPPITIHTVVAKTFYLQQPATLARVLRQTLSTSSTAISCQQINNQAYVAINYQFRLTGYRNFDGELNQWQTQIVSADYDRATGRVWALLSNGDLVLLEPSKQYIHQLRQIKRYQQRRNMGWLEGSLQLTKAFLFLRVGSSIKLITLKGEFWQEESVQLDSPVVESIAEGDELFVMTSKQVWIIGPNRQRRSYQNKAGELVFKDIDVQGKYAYILANQQVLIVDKDTLQLANSIEIEEGEWASQLAVGQKYAVIHFRKHKQSVLREFQIAEEGTSLQPAVLHHQFQTIKDILILDDNAVVLSSFEFTLFQLNLNYDKISGMHNSPLPFKYQNIVTLSQIVPKKKDLLLAGPNFIELASVRSKLSDSNIYSGVLACSSQQVEQIQLRVKYEGLCYQDHSQLCESQIIYLITAKQDTNNRLFPTLEAFLMILMLLMLLFGCIYYHQAKWAMREEIKARTVSSNKLKEEVSEFELKEIPQSIGKKQLR